MEHGHEQMSVEMHGRDHHRAAEMYRKSGLAISREQGLRCTCDAGLEDAILPD